MVILMFAMCLWFLQTDRQIDVTRDTAAALGQMAAANRELATAVKEYTDWDDARAEAQDAALRYVAGNSDKILEKLGDYILSPIPIKTRHLQIFVFLS